MPRLIKLTPPPTGPPAAIITQPSQRFESDSSPDELPETPALSVITQQGRERLHRLVAPTESLREEVLDPLRRRIHDAAATDSHNSPAAVPFSKQFANSQLFDKANEKYSPPTNSLPYPVPDFAESAIRKCLLRVWGKEASPYQVEALYQLIFRKVGLLYLIRKTGEGKSLVLQGMATMLRGLTISLVPLLGLGSDQVTVAQRIDHRVEGYHADEYREQDFETLRYRLLQLKSQPHQSIILFLSPMKLEPDSKWVKLLKEVTSMGLLSSVCVDEVHAAVEHSESFRPVFSTAITTLNNLIDISQQQFPEKKIPMMAMSATFRIDEQARFNKMVKRFPDAVIWGRMDRRNIGIFANISGEPINPLMDDWKLHSTANSDHQSLIMTNSAKACDERLMDELEKARSKLSKEIQQECENHEFVSFVGDGGLMYKIYLMNAFCSGDLDEESELPMIWCMACTSAANCGVSSKRCHKCYRYGPPPNWHDFVQECGRVDRLLNGAFGLNKYLLYFNVGTFMGLWIRIQREPKHEVRERSMTRYMELIKMLICPKRCYHETIEEYFENPAARTPIGPCGTNCSYCTNAHKSFTGKISKTGLIGVLLANVFDKGPVPSNSFVGCFTGKKMSKVRKQIFGKQVKAGPIHALLLQLMCADIIAPKLKDESLLGKDQLQMKNVEFILVKTVIKNSDGAYEENLALYDDRRWKYLNI